jgi:RND family efflux transporter MFP subunit
MRRVFVILIDAIVPLAVLAVALAGMRFLIVSRPEVPKVEREARPTLVETTLIPETAPQVWVGAFGTVEPAREVELRPQVEGLVVEQNDKLIAGGIVSEGERLLKIDPRDYEYLIEQREAALVTAGADLRMEEGRQIVAQREWELLESSVPVTKAGRELALRVPNYEERKAAVRSAESQLAQAELSLERTVLRAPFNAIVIEESVDLGQYLSPQNTVARLVGTDTYFVEASVPARYLGWVKIPGPGTDAGEGSLVRITKQVEGQGHLSREGRVVGILGDVDPNGRMARLRIELRDPLGLKTNTPLADPFLVGDYVRVSIEGPVIEHALEIPRLALRQDDEVWVMSPEGKLEVHRVNVLYREAATVIIHGGLEAGDPVITSSLPEAIPGMTLTTELPTESSNGEADGEPGTDVLAETETETR